MTAFHDTTITILKHVLAEQNRDLTLFQHRLERADAGASPDAVQKFRDQIAELTAVAGDFRRLVTLALAANAVDAAGLPAEITLDARAGVTDAATEAFVEVADAERYALRDDYVNAAEEQAGREMDAAVESTGHLPGHQDGKHVDYAEAADVRQIEEEMALEAAGVESWDQL